MPIPFLESRGTYPQNLWITLNKRGERLGGNYQKIKKEVSDLLHDSQLFIMQELQQLHSLRILRSSCLNRQRTCDPCELDKLHAVHAMHPPVQVLSLCS